MPPRRDEPAEHLPLAVPQGVADAAVLHGDQLDLARVDGLRVGRRVVVDARQRRPERQEGTPGPAGPSTGPAPPSGRAPRPRASKHGHGAANPPHRCLLSHLPGPPSLPPHPPAGRNPTPGHPAGEGPPIVADPPQSCQAAKQGRAPHRSHRQFRPPTQAGSGRSGSRRDGNGRPENGLRPDHAAPTGLILRWRPRDECVQIPLIVGMSGAPGAHGRIIALRPGDAGPEPARRRHLCGPHPTHGGPRWRGPRTAGAPTARLGCPPRPYPRPFPGGRRAAPRRRAPGPARHAGRLHGEGAGLRPQEDHVRRRAGRSAAGLAADPRRAEGGRRGHRRPAVLCLHQTVAIGKDEPVGLGGKPDLRYAMELARADMSRSPPITPGSASTRSTSTRWGTPAPP